MAPIRLDRIGVGQYDARQPRIEAEDYFDAADAEQRECPEGGFEVRGLGEGSYLVYPNITHLAPAMRMTLRAACGNRSGATLEIHEKNPAGKILGFCQIPSTGGWNHYQTIDCELKMDASVAGFCLVPKGGSGELLRLNWFSLHTI
jgi:hypothetical protein